MLTPYEIAVLRKQGHLDEAYSAAKDALATSADNQNELLRLLGFIVCDQLKSLAGAASASFLAKLKDFSDLHIPESEMMIYNSLLWNLRAFVVDEHKSDEDITHGMDTLFDLTRPMPIRRQSDAFSAFVGAVLHHAGAWSRLGEWALWCGFDGLQPKDFQSFTTQDNKRLMSLAEQLDCKIGKYLLSDNHRQQIVDFLPTQEQFAAAHPDYTYPPYYLAKMYIAVGELQKAQSTLIPFMRRKAHDFWVWELMAEATPDIDMQLAFYCKALTCKTKEGMNIGLYQAAAVAFARSGDYNTARYLIDRACQIRQAHKWAIPRTLQEMMRQSWYATAQPRLDKARVAEYTARAEAVCPQRKKTDKGERKDFEGKLHLNPKGYGFVDNIFIPAHLIGTHKNGDTIKGIAVSSFNKSKNQPGFKAEKIWS